MERAQEEGCEFFQTPQQHNPARMSVNNLSYARQNRDVHTLVAKTGRRAVEKKQIRHSRSR